MKGNYQLDVLSSGGKSGKRTSSMEETDWAFPAKKPRSSTNPDNEEPTITKDVPPVPTTASCTFDKNQYRIIDMEQLSCNISTHLTCRKCASNNKLDKLPTVQFVLMGDYGAACKIGIHCLTCESISTVHKPKTVCIEGTPNVVTQKRKKKISRCNDSTKYAINHQLVLLMQSLGLGCDGVMTLLTLLGIGGPIKTWKHRSLFQRVEEMLAMVEHDVTQESMDAALLEEMELTLIDNPEQLAEWNLTLEQWKALPDDIRKSTYRVVINVLYDMGWQKRNSGHNYDSLSGHAYLIGSRSNKIIGLSVLAKSCQGCYLLSKNLTTDADTFVAGTSDRSSTGDLTLELLEEIHEEEDPVVPEEEDPNFYEEKTEQEGDIYIPKFGVNNDHVCTKNYDGASKGMEAHAFIRMLIDGFDNRGFIVGSVVADDDSSVRANSKHVDASKKDDTGMLPDRVPEPVQWYTDGNHFIRHVLKKIFGMTNTVGDGQNPTKFFARRLKDLLGCALRENAYLPFDEFVLAVRCVPNHLFDEHNDCGAWCKRKDDPDYDKGKYWDPVTYSKMKERVWKALNQDLSSTSLLRVHHKYHTQLCEALQNAVSYRAPKNRTYSRTISLYGRACIVAGEHNMGKDEYVKKLMKRMGIDLPRLSISILEYKTKRKKKQREFQNTPAQKYRRKKKEHDTMKEQRVKDEKSRATYGRRIKREKERKPRDRCGDCQMFDHRTKKTKTCFANPSHPLHETFNTDRPTAVVLAGEAYVTQMKAKKRGRNKKYQLPKDMWDQVMANKELNVRGALCCECAATEGVARMQA